MKKIDGRTKAGRALKAKQARKETRRQLRDAAVLASAPSGFTAALEPTPTVGGTGVYGAKYVPLDLNNPPTSAFTTQVGGDHYTRLAIQPMEYSFKNKLDPAQHTAIKYITRFRDKGGKRDLEAAKHVLDMLIELEYGAPHA